MTNPIAERAKKVPLLIRMLVLIPCIGIPLFWIVTDTGVYFWAAEWQANNLLDGEHYIVLSGLLAFLVPLIPAAAFIQLLATWYVRKEKEEAMQEGNQEENF